MSHNAGMVYKLIDPRDNTIFYIGQTRWKLQSRLTSHLNDKKPCPKKTKIDEIRAHGLKPIIEPVEIVTLANIPAPWNENIKRMHERERYWIQWHRSKGYPLLNCNPVQGNTLACYSHQTLRNKYASLTRREQALTQELTNIQEKKLQVSNLLLALQAEPSTSMLDTA